MRRRLAAMILFITACGGGDSNTTTFSAPEMPTVDQFQSAADCDVLNGLLVQADAARFWEHARLTVEEAEAMAAEQEGAFEPANGPEPSDLDRAFSDRQVELGCSDTGMVQALETAIRDRCEGWMTAGHSPDEEPLLVNTAFCAGRLE